MRRTVIDMLHYLGYGIRNFGRQPMYVHRRLYWEFFAVLQGRCGPVLRARDEPDLQSARLWIFPPRVPHGWKGLKSATCRVAVFHFSEVPRQLQRLTEGRHHLEIRLTARECATIDRLAASVQPHLETMTDLGALVFDRALLDLSILVLDKFPSRRSDVALDFAVQKVASAIAWFMENMARKPKLSEVAEAVNLSVRHLRRLFNAVRKQSPQKVFVTLRIERAMELMSETGHKLETVAHACGFASASDFSRVFRQHRGINPEAWRRRSARASRQG